MARETKKVLTGITQEVAEQAFAEYAKAESKTNELTAKMEQQITNVREKYQDDLATLRETKDSQLEILEIFARENEELFKGKKSFDMAHGTIGYRTGTPKLKLLKGFKWESVKELIKKYLPDFIRVEEEVNKAGLLQERDNKEVNKQFSKCGIVVDQDETFFVNTKEEKIAA